MTRPRRYLLVGNPTARSGAARESLLRAQSGLVRRGQEVVFAATEPEGRTVEVVRAALHREPFDAVVYLGGDGTFNEVARGILASSLDVPMGMLPMGTANDQGRSFGVRPGPEAIEENLDVLVAGHVTRLDAGRIEALDDAGNTRRTALFFDSAGFGLQSDILASRNRDREVVSQIPLVRDLYRDQALYAGAALEGFLGSFVEPTKFDAVVDADDRRYELSGLTDLILKGTAVYAGEWVLDRHGEPDDGRMELVPIAGRRDWLSKAMRDLAKVPIWQEDLDVLGVTHSEGFSFARLLVTFERPERREIPSQIDGEEWLAGDRFRVEVLPRVLSLITPAGFTPPWKA